MLEVPTSEVISEETLCNASTDLMYAIVQTEVLERSILNINEYAQINNKDLVSLKEIKSYVLSEGYIDHIDIVTETEKEGTIYRCLGEVWAIHGKTRGY